MKIFAVIFFFFFKKTQKNKMFPGKRKKPRNDATNSGIDSVLYVVIQEVLF